MKTKNIFLALLVATFGLFSCADDSKKPILTYEQTTKGGYAKLIEQSDKLINVLNEGTINASKYTYSVEFVDLENGGLLTEYKLDLTYENVAGDIKEVQSFKSWGQSDLTDGPNGLRALLDIEITAPDMMAALGLTAADLGPGDKFLLEGFVTLSDGNTYGFDNSSAAVNGTAFGGHFNITIPAACPSDLAGSYAFEGFDYWCGAAGVAGTVDILPKGGGTYGFSDWAFGGYICYGGGTSTGPEFTDVCAEVAFTGFTDSFGDAYTIQESSIVGNEWTIKWRIDAWGESGTGVIYYPNGADWPITLVD